MTQISRLRRSVTTSASPQSKSHRQLSLTFESSVLRGMTPNERSNVIAQLAIVLLQAAGVQPREADDEQL
ncbi:hypothetical protein GFK26_03615 [Variovorax paradoxus]|uniref:Uncharacterized protein n=1 Tax=Variovorax paradoxus TaxID=34073 RepID=A0A5Q0M010_VARPD|nr:hypothetical protein [Variovorax paradoxus]QFZ81914.1 hypothetical protein GFK26_03615 [Variovorax paradoxus]